METTSKSESNNPEDSMTTNNCSSSMQVEMAESVPTEINFVEESVGEIVVPSSSQAEGPSASRTSQTETATSSVATETTAATGENSLRPRIIRFIAHAHQSLPGVDDGRINRRYVDLKLELMKKKVDFLRLKRERLMEEFDLRMKLLRTQLTFEEKKLLIFRKKYRR